MARRMIAADDLLVSFDSDFRVLVSTEQEYAELWVRQYRIGDAPEPYELAEEVAAGETDLQIRIPTPNPGWITQARLFALQTGTPTGDGELIDELIVPRLDRSLRRTFLTDCSEGFPQLDVTAGGTFVRAVVASGTTVTLGQLFVGTDRPTWDVGTPFPVFAPGTSLLSAVSAAADLIHDVLLVDGRSAGWTSNTRLGYGMALWYVALVFDSDGAWDFTWSSSDPMPTQPGGTLPVALRVSTLDRRVDLHVTALVCLDDSDDASYGEATFTLAVRPSDGTPDQTRTIVWDPMASSSSKVVDERFTLLGAAAGSPALAVAGLEDDSESPFGDDDDGAITSPFRLSFPDGPGVEAFHQEITLDAGPGGDDFRFQVHCTADVSYV